MILSVHVDVLGLDTVGLLRSVKRLYCSDLRYILGAVSSFDFSNQGLLRVFSLSLETNFALHLRCFSIMFRTVKAPSMELWL